MGLLDDLRSKPAEDSGVEYAPSWRWEQPGDGVEGIVVSVDRRKNDNHPDGYPIVTIKQADGTDIAVHCMATVLKNEVEEQRPRPGDEFAVVYDGKKSSGAGRQYNAFRVASRPAPAAPNAQWPTAPNQPPAPQQAPAQQGAWGAPAQDAPPF
jgi:hypothetical protein